MGDAGRPGRADKGADVTPIPLRRRRSSGAERATEVVKLCSKAGPRLTCAPLLHATPMTWALDMGTSAWCARSERRGGVATFDGRRARGQVELVSAALDTNRQARKLTAALAAATTKTTGPRLSTCSRRPARSPARGYAAELRPTSQYKNEAADGGPSRSRTGIRGAATGQPPIK